MDAAAAELLPDDPGEPQGRPGEDRHIHRSGRSSTPRSSSTAHGSPGSSQGSRPPLRFASNASGGGGNSPTLSNQGSPSGKKMLEEHWGAKRSLAKLSFSVADDDNGGGAAAEQKDDRHETFGSAWHDDDDGEAAI